jgi:hypothetical protein
MERRPRANPAILVPRAIRQPVHGSSRHYRHRDWHADVPPNIQSQRHYRNCDSFVGVDLGNLTGETYNSANLIQGNSLDCFVILAVQAGLPDTLKASLGDIMPALESVD